MEANPTVEYLRTQFSHAIVEEKTALGETTVEVHKDAIKDILRSLKHTPNPGFEVLMDLTGVDFIHPEKRTKIVYWLHNPSTFARIRIVAYVKRDESIPSVVELWEGADWYEREIFDFFGVKFEGHPDLRRILMPDDWLGHPLRRDYALTEEPVQFKYEVKPKIPSKILSYDEDQDKQQSEI